MPLTRLQKSSVINERSATSRTVTFPAACAIGNGVIVYICSENHNDLPTVTDNKGNTYTLATQQLEPDGVGEALIFYCPLVTASGAYPFTITVTWGALASMLIVAVEVTGVGSTGLVVDQIVKTNGTSSTPATGSTAALTADNVFLASIVACNNIGSVVVQSVTPTWFEEHANSAGFDSCGESDSRILTGVLGTTQSCSWVFGSSDGWAAALVAFAASGSSATGIRRVRIVNPLAGGTLNFTFPTTSPEIGNAIIVPFSAANVAIGNLRCTDNWGNTYEIAVVRSSGSAHTGAFLCPVITATGSPFTVTTSGPSHSVASVIEVAGFTGGSLRVDRTLTATGTSTTPSIGPTAALQTTADAFLVACMSDSNNTFVLVPGGAPVWIHEGKHESTISSEPGSFASKIVPAATGTTHSCSWTMASSSWRTSIIAFVGADTLSTLLESRVTQDVAEVLSVPVNPSLRVTQDLVEVLTFNSNPSLRVTQSFVEILTGTPFTEPPKPTTQFYVIMP